MSNINFLGYENQHIHEHTHKVHMFIRLMFKCKTEEKKCTPEEHKAFLMTVATIQCLNYTGLEIKSKKQNLQCLFLTHLSPWNRSKSSNLVANLESCKVWNTLLTQCPRNTQTVCFCFFVCLLLLLVFCLFVVVVVFWGVNSVMHQLSPLNTCESQKQWYIHDLVNVINNHAKFQLNRIRT